LNNEQAAMLNTKGMRFPNDVILVCIRWYAAYLLSYRHLEEMMQERGVVVDHSSIAGRSGFCLYWKRSSETTSTRLVKAGAWMRHILRGTSNNT
jgi:transposase-like protein